MQPMIWHPPIELTAMEQKIVERIRRAKLFVFLRQHRHELFNEVFQQEFAGLYQSSKKGQPPIPPAKLALATILQAYTGVSDDEVIEATVMDRRWQLVLDCVDAETTPFSKGTLVAFRNRLIQTQMDRRLIERTIEVANQSQAFGPRALRAALDSSPLWGAGQVEDTYNLVGHALKKVMRVVADQQERDLVEVAQEAGAELVCGTSLKAALDRDWDQQMQKDEALTLVLRVLHMVDAWVKTLTDEEDKAVAEPVLTIAKQIEAQDVQISEKGNVSLVKGVAKDRRISVEDGQMRHGRKSRSVRVDRYKRHVLHDLDTGLIRAVGITPANIAEASVTEAISEDLEQQAVCLKELHIDRAYLSSHLVRERSDDLVVHCKAWPVRDSKRISKQATKATLIRWTHTLRPETLHALNDRVVQLAVQAKVTEGRKLCLDATCVLTEIHHPTDSGLLVDSVRVLSRVVQRAKGLLQEQVSNMQQLCSSRLRTARRTAQTLHRGLRRKGEDKEAEQKKLYEKLVETTEHMVKQVKKVVGMLNKETQEPAIRLVKQAEQMLPLVERVIAQTGPGEQKGSVE